VVAALGKRDFQWRGVCGVASDGRADACSGDTTVLGESRPSLGTASSRGPKECVKVPSEKVQVNDSRGSVVSSGFDFESIPNGDAADSVCCD
jgi:hypothetical protein